MSDRDFWFMTLGGVICVVVLVVSALGPAETLNLMGGFFK